VAEYEPALQFVHPLARAGEYVPARQLEQLTARPALNLPASQPLLGGKREGG